MRTFFIWFFGLLTGSFGGMLLGDVLAPRSQGAIMGLIVGVAGFCCLRLWLAKRVTNP